MDTNIFNTLKQLDSIIDFSRSKLQWDILFTINSKGPCSVSEIANITGNSKKSVTDAIRKLIEKELVIKVKYDIYDLSEKGRQLVSILNKLLINDDRSIKQELNNPLSSLGENLVQLFYLIELVKISLLNNGEVNPGKVSKELGVSTQTLKYYLDLFTERKMFKRVSKKNLLGKSYQIYVLNVEGKKIAYKIPILVKLRRNVFLKILLKMTFSINYETSLLKLMAILSLTSPILIYFKNYDVVHLIAIIWLFMLIFSTLLGIFAYISMK
ncbi:hypothetical protein BFU36_09940 [Sulfolobus sp. A20]|uniref:MarR family transcriptional regulator n=1 Tax=Saccharolobus sp. A20 TaxID=1891280 RepID=UPI000846188E|nr:winged helix-turn-helix transcriptional regulator [Sulfolobus sp. A20]AOL16976.1 hypothetical protein BFU36_09940 [Sulfolobus sp. A20]TRM74313.1 MarR family transcriptional regulator [Sulfolobus sp. E5]TRM77977.1 MarR family transcriptional regulator [Sulfolobus sp. A20-N-F8]